jgi:rubrerythrin
VTFAPGEAADSVRSLAASAWLFRWRVELEADARFGRLAERLRSLGASPSVIALALRSAQDERRHAGLCSEIAADLGADTEAAPPADARELAPPRLTLRGRVLYEVVAACCVAETESVGVLTTLLHVVRDGPLRRVLRELASDEVRHARLGWAHLAGEHAAGVTGFLGPLVPAMLQGNAPSDLFHAVPPERDDERLLAYGVLPHRLKREVFARTLADVVFPGLEASGVDAGPARAWLARRRAEAAGRARAEPAEHDAAAHEGEP